MEKSSRRNRIIAVVVVILVLLFLLIRCKPVKPAATGQTAAPPPAPAPSAVAVQPGPGTPAAEEPDEILTPATVQAPPQIGAGAKFSVTWTGPNNRGDYLTIVRQDAPENASGDYYETKGGSPLKLTASIEPGDYEVRYVTARSRKILGRAPVTVMAAVATLNAASEIVLGSSISVTWTGPNNAGDYITIVPKDTPDGQYGHYTSTAEGSPLKLTAPTVTGDAELRYMTGQGGKVLGRHPIRIVAADVALSGPDSAIAGTTINVAWTGPNNAGDYITVVSKDTPDGQYGNYSNTASGSPLPVTMPIMAGDAELRYMTGQDGKVLGRRSIRIVAAEVSLSAPAMAAAGSAVSITWKGPNNPGDYLTIVAKDAADGQYGEYTNTNAGSPLIVNAPKAAGIHEIRYMTGQDGKVLSRRSITITP